ncbi:hypothetical protein CAOG_03140 [Capsaspora owczarzaki ATCC 30864]|uniref:Uncharacterized protein n=1 Tax=Capsaspora owczarzaki (strain ATCC 30864) TaxID=595528 RepID=A0A0D2VP21_CAPO3|nr:hypothetical protein CAOG_03140 [Capsaspora owczarzaki ATCC 30864]KJE92117.1 hypothetical protein CAOG_003140 [Capsaspora owczarzaki ATCC 30864]|eukprot:XP_004363979.1 hypothetical protein CAOG_03140 [Capsaspora owczarzaki ATCC 30864]
MSWLAEEWKSGLSAKVLTKIEEIEQQVQRLTRDNGQKQLHIETTEASLEKARSAEANATKNYTTIQRELTRISDERNRLDTSNKKLEAEAGSRTQQLQVLEAQVAKAKERTDADAVQVSRLNADISLLRENLEKSRREASDKSADLARVLELNTNLNALVAQHQSTIREADSTRGRLETQLLTLEKQLDTMRQQTTAGGLTMADVQSKLESTRLAAEDARAQLLKSRGEADGRNQELTNAVEKLRGQLVASENERENARAETERMRLSLENMQSARNSSASQLQQLESQHEARLAVIAQEFDKERSASATSAAALGQQLRESEQQLALRTKEVSTLAAQLQETTARVSELEHEMTTHNATSSGDSAALAELREQLHVAQRQADAASAQVAKLEGDLAVQAGLVTRAQHAASEAESIAAGEQAKALADLTAKYQAASAAVEQVKSKAAAESHELSTTNASLCNRLEAVQQEFAALQAAHTAQSAKLDSVAHSHAVKEQRMAETMTKLTETEQQVATLQTLLEKSSVRVAELEQQVSSNATDATNRGATVSQLNARVASLEEECSRVRQTATQESGVFIARAEELEMELISVKQTLAQTTEALASKESRLASTKSELQAVSDQRATIASNLELLQMDVDDKDAMLHQQEVKLSNLSEECARLHAQVAALDDAKENLTNGASNRVNALQEELGVCRARLLEVEGQLSATSQSSQGKSDRLASLERAQAALDQQHAEAVSRLETVSFEAEELRQTVTNMTADLDRARTSSARLNEQLNAKEEAFMSLQTQTNKLQTELHDARETLSSADKRQAAAHDEALDKQARLESLCNKVAELEEELQKNGIAAEKRVAELSANAQRAQGSAESAELSMQEMQAQVSAKNAQIQQLSDELESCEGRLRELVSQHTQLVEVHAQTQDDLASKATQLSNAVTLSKTQTEQNDSLNGLIAQVRSDAAKAGDEKTLVEVAFAELTRKHQTTSDKLEQTESKLLDTRAMLQAAETKIESLSALAASGTTDLTTKLQETRDQLATCQHSLDAERTRVSKLQHTLDKLTEEDNLLMQNFKATTKQLETSDAAWKAEKAALSEKLDLAEQNVLGRERVLAEVRAKLAETSSLHERAVAGMEILQLDMDDAAAEVASTNQQMDFLNQRMKGMTRDLQQSREEAASLTATKNTLVSELEKSAISMADLQAQLGRANLTCEQRQTAIDMLKDQCKALDAKLSGHMNDAEHAMSSSSAQVESLQAELKQCTFKLEATSQQAEERALLVSRLQEQNSALDCKLQGAIGNVERLEASLADCQAELTDATHNVSVTLAAKNHLDQEYASTRASLKAAETKLAEFEALTEQQEADLANAKADLTDRQLRLDNTAQAVADLRASVNQLHVQVSERDQALVDCEKRFGNQLRFVQEELDTAREQLARRHSDGLERSERVVTLMSELEQSQAKSGVLQTEISSLKQAAEINRRALTEMEQTLAETEESCVDLKDQVHHLSIKQTSLQLERDQLAADVARVHQHYQSEQATGERASEKALEAASLTTTAMLQIETVLKTTQGQLAVFESDLQIAAEQVDVYRTRVAALESEVERRATDLTAKDAELQAALTALEAKNSELAVEQQNAEGDVRSSQLQQEADRVCREKLEAEVDNLRAKLAAAETENQSLSNDLASLQRDMDVEKHTMSDWEATLKETTSERDSLQDQLATNLRVREELEQQIRSLDLKVAELADDAASALEQHAALSQEHDKVISERQAAQADALKLAEAAAANQKRHDATTTALAEARTMITELQAAVESSGKSSSEATGELQQQLTEALKQAEASDRRAIASSAESKLLEESVAQLREELEQTSQLCKDVEAQLADTTKQNTANIQALSAKLAAVESNLSIALADKAKLESRVIQLQEVEQGSSAELAELQQLLATAQAEATTQQESLEKALREHRAVVAKLEVDMEESVATAQRALDRADESDARMETMQSDLAKHQDLLADERTKIEQLTLALKEVNAEKSSLESRVTDATAASDKLQEQLKAVLHERDELELRVARLSAEAAAASAELSSRVSSASSVSPTSSNKRPSSEMLKEQEESDVDSMQISNDDGSEVAAEPTAQSTPVASKRVRISDEVAVEAPATNNASSPILARSSALVEMRASGVAARASGVAARASGVATRASGVPARESGAGPVQAPGSGVVKSITRPLTRASDRARLQRPLITSGLATAPAAHTTGGAARISTLTNRSAISGGALRVAANAAPTASPAPAARVRPTLASSDSTSSSSAAAAATTASAVPRPLLSRTTAPAAVAASAAPANENVTRSTSAAATAIPSASVFASKRIMTRASPARQVAKPANTNAVLPDNCAFFDLA